MDYVHVPLYCIRLCSLYWPDDLNVDIDLWTRTPDGDTIGYSASHGESLDLLRDDLGNDASSNININREIAVSRYLETGEYIVNLHYYAFKDNPDISKVMPVKVLITMRQTRADGSENTITVYSGVTTLEYVGQEITAVRFSLDSNHNFIRDSVNNLQLLIRGQATSGGRE